MDIRELYYKPLPTVPADIKDKLNNKEITLTLFEDKNSILKNISLQEEIGYRQFEDGSYLVSMTCPMPNITPEMIEWWFWWHPKEDIRYQVWYPNSHFGTGFAKKDSSYFLQPEMPPFQPNTQYPIERISGIKMPLRIDFTTPEAFGFSKEDMLENDIPLIVCGHVGSYKGLIMHTEMAHIFKKTNEGLLLISRFWLGKTLKNKLLRKILLTDKTAYGMAEHCCIEYRNLVEILPLLYSKEK